MYGQLSNLYLCLELDFEGLPPWLPRCFNEWLLLCLLRCRSRCLWSPVFGLWSPRRPKIEFYFFTNNILLKQARKGFRPPSAMKGIGYFQNLRNLLRIFLEFFWIFWEIFWEFFRRIFLKEFIWRNFWEKYFGRIFWEDIFGRNSLGGIT